MKGSLLFHSGNFLEAISDTKFERGGYPEPFDFPNHIGNFREAAMVTTAAYAMIGLKSVLEASVEWTACTIEDLKRSAKKIAVGAFVASSSVQIVGESTGISNGVFETNTPDALDAAYGIGWSGVVALTAYGLTVSYLDQRAHQLDVNVNE